MNIYHVTNLTVSWTHVEMTTNQPCHCGRTSKRQVSGTAKGRRVNYGCRMGGCGYYRPHLTVAGDSLTLEEYLVLSLDRLYLV